MLVKGDIVGNKLVFFVEFLSDERGLAPVILIIIIILLVRIQRVLGLAAVLMVLQCRLLGESSDAYPKRFPGGGRGRPDRRFMDRNHRRGELGDLR